MGYDLIILFSYISRIEEEVFILYRISFMIYTLIGWLIMFIVGIAVSLMTEPPNLDEINTAVFAPFIRKYVKKKRRSSSENETTQMNLLNEFPKGNTR